MRKLPQKSTTNVKAKLRASLTFRMNVLFFAIFVLFSTLIFRLGYLQIVKGEEYVRELERTEELRVNTSVPRGRIYDRYGRILVDNEPENAITYTKMQTTKSAEMLEIAKQLAELIDQPTKRVTYRDKLDFWIMTFNEEAKAKVTEKEMEAFRATDEEMEDKVYNAEYDQRIRDRITEKELAQLTDFDIEVLAIYREMTTGYYLSPQIIKGEDVTDEEFARVSERLADLPGVNTTTDWKRVRLSPLGLIGRTTVPSKGVPKSKLNFYLARDYSRNDRVGESYFEGQYEEILQGEKSVVKNLTNKKGQVIETVTTYPGEPGKDLLMTIDSELQLQSEAVLEKYMWQLKEKGASKYFDRAFYIMMNPNTGEILSMIGKKFDRDENGKLYIGDYSYGTYQESFSVGSTVKGATVLMGYQEDVIQVGSRIVDEPIMIGAQRKASLFNQGGRFVLTDAEALERSSNVYMWRIAMQLAKDASNTKFGINRSTFQIMSNAYAQFGLGVLTNVDLPNESAGVQGDYDKAEPGNALDYAIGQYESYTPMQLAQYVSTIANNGYRVQPRLLKEIRKPSEDGKTLGPIEMEKQTVVLNRIDNTQAEIDQVKYGFNRVYTASYGTSKRAFNGAKFTAGGKTGTAESRFYEFNESTKSYTGIPTITVSHVGFAPYENPEVAYAIIMPHITTNYSSYSGEANYVAREILDQYFEIRERNKQNGTVDSNPTVEIKPAITQDILQEDEE